MCWQCGEQLFFCRVITFRLHYRRFRWVVVCTFEVWVLLSLWMNSHNCLALPALPKIAASLSSDNAKSSWILSTFLMTDLEKKREDSVTEPNNMSLSCSWHAQHFSFPIYRRTLNLQPFIICLCTGCFWHCWSYQYAGCMSYIPGVPGKYPNYR